MSKLPVGSYKVKNSLNKWSYVKMCMRKYLKCLVLVSLLPLCGLAAGTADNEPKKSVDHMGKLPKDINQIFRNYCISCHGPDKKKGWITY